MRTSSDDDLIPVTKAIRQHLRAEIRRTGITALMLLRDDVTCPSGLTASVVNRWIGGIVKAAPKPHLSHVMARWAAFADGQGFRGKDGAILERGRRHRKPDEEWIEVTEMMAKTLRAEFVRTDRNATTILDDATDVPVRLTPRIVRGWLYQDAETTDAANWGYVIARLAALPTINDITL